MSHAPQSATGLGPHPWHMADMPGVLLGTATPSLLRKVVCPLLSQLDGSQPGDCLRDRQGRFKDAVWVLYPSWVLKGDCRFDGSYVDDCRL
jgi:hypothetical protein